jgi:hypothetical protein
MNYRTVRTATIVARAGESLGRLESHPGAEMHVGDDRDGGTPVSPPITTQKGCGDSSRIWLDDATCICNPSRDADW